MIELLAPCGDMESVKAAVLYGADAVYVGGDMGLRVNAAFSGEELVQAVGFAHGHGVKVYLACNIVACNADIDKFAEFAESLNPSHKRRTANGGFSFDGVIVSDLGVLDLVRTRAPEMPVHISTQAGVMNYAAANMLYRSGASRVILAREASLEDIRRIRAETPPELEIEAFVHGAMCMAFSGRCLVSNYLAGRDANKGNCAQPCRWNYKLVPQEYSLVESTRPDELFPVIEDERGSYILNSRDLCMIEHIPDLVNAGITTFKIEGRAKTAYYTAIVTNAYRVAIDSYYAGKPCPDWVKREVNCVSHRPYCTGFYFGNDANIEPTFSGYVRDCDFVAVVDGYSGGVLEIIQRNYFTTGQVLEVVEPGKPPAILKIEQMYNKNNETVTIANHAVERLRIKCGREFVKGSMIRRVNK
jgi:putative protease